MTNNKFTTNIREFFHFQILQQAITITSTITDRRCIKSFGYSELPVSPMMLLSCCPNCGGCSGGSIVNAWKFVRDKGLVSGSMNANSHYLHQTDVLKHLPNSILIGPIVYFVSLQIFTGMPTFSY